MTEEQPGVEPGSDRGPHVFVDDLARPAFAPGDRHHLTRVLRLRTGDSLTISDGRGAWRRCRLVADALEPTGPVVDVAAPLPTLTVAFALVKGQKPELVVQKLTELGVDVIVPYPAERSVARWDPARGAAHHQRLVRVAREAAMQSRRCRLPEVTPMASYAEVASLPAAGRVDRGGSPPTLATPTLLVGPEGGWSDEERRAGLPVIGLGPHVLRAETAAITAGAVLAGLRAGLWTPPGDPARVRPRHE